MAEYKLIINLDATLAVQNTNGSYNYFKPSVGAEVLIGETDDMMVLNNKFQELYNKVVAPNFSAVVEEFILNIAGPEEDEQQVEDKKTCGCNNEFCTCGGDGCNCSDDKVDSSIDNNSENLSREDWE